jgi:hypothetical protein
MRRKESSGSEKRAGKNETRGKPQFWKSLREKMKRKES